MANDVNERLKVRVFGCEIGTSNGWDQADDQCLIFPDFEPELFLYPRINKGTLSINFDTGLIEVWDAEKVIQTVQTGDFLQSIALRINGGK